MGADCIQANLVGAFRISQQKRSEWSLKEVIFTGVKLTMAAESETSVAVPL